MTCNNCDGGARSELSCPCASGHPVCPPCIVAKAVKQIHEIAENQAKSDAKTQDVLSKESELQSKLFKQAEKYALEASVEEKKAREAALALQEASSKAQIARNKMMRVGIL